MYFIIANVPENFHSADLRNFFSEFIEKEAFNCFHFRHRPQSNLLNILNKSLTLSGVKAPQSEVGGDKGGSDQRQTTDKAGRKTDNSGHREGSDTASIGTGHRLSGRTEDESDDSSKAEGDGEGSGGSKTHWLSSGLAGLSALISEKKKQFKPSKKWPGDVEEVASKRPSGVEDVWNESEGDGSSGEPFSSLVEVLPPLQEEEASKRTCCVVDVKDGLQERFIKKYDRKHWLTRSGDILPQRCYLLRVDFRDSSQSSGESMREI